MQTKSPVYESNRSAFLQMSQDYEREFSPITKKLPQANGLFSFTDHEPGVFEAWVTSVDGEPAGFAVIGILPEVFDVAEFYIKPEFRKQNIGKNLALELFDHYQGAWQVRQILGAKNAREFWLKVIASYTFSNFSERIMSDVDWGQVYAQTFHSRSLKT